MLTVLNVIYNSPQKYLPAFNVKITQANSRRKRKKTGISQAETQEKFPSY